MGQFASRMIGGIWSPSGNAGNNITSVTFTNQAEGTIEICKNAADPQTLGKPFQFSVNGGAPIIALAGGCSPAIVVPAVVNVSKRDMTCEFQLWSGRLE